MGVASTTLYQNGFRARNDDGSETTATWKKALNTNWEQSIHESFRVRFLIVRAARISDNTNMRFDLWYTLNGGALDFVGNTGMGPGAGTQPVNASLTTSYQQGDDTTQQIGSGTFVTDNNHMAEEEARGNAFTFPAAGGETEMEAEYCISFNADYIKEGDVITLQCLNSNTLFSGGYAEIPSITAVSRGFQIRGSSISIAGGTIEIR
jgi:hypothetical protein